MDERDGTSVERAETTHPVFTRRHGRTIARLRAVAVGGGDLGIDRGEHLIVGRERALIHVLEEVVDPTRAAQRALVRGLARGADPTSFFSHY